MVNNELKNEVMAYFKIRSRNLPGRTEENYINLSHNRWSLVLSSSRKPSEYKWEALPLEPVYIYVSAYGSTALVDLGRFFSFLIYTQSVGLLGRGISPSQGHYLHTEQHKHRINVHRYPCHEWDSNPRSQCSRGRRRFMHYTARPLWSASASVLGLKPSWSYYPNIIIWKEHIMKLLIT
jgi:hypothetical protein